MQKQQQISVTDPSGRFELDITSLFGFFEKIESNTPDISLNVARDNVERTCRMFSTGIDKEVLDYELREYKHTLNFLYEVKDFFSGIKITELTTKTIIS